MTIETPFRNIIDLQNALVDLSHDIHDIRVHGWPNHPSLANAPWLENWSSAALFSPCLIGEVTDHPLLGDRPRIHTSQLMVLDAERGWARTWSRFYRLGPPHHGDRHH
ncbi:DUF6634 family protein [Nitrobacter vulgaris]|uniref:Uncharacterized protein n=1 Tax=Nitrobacter vulgaris TaxID=29421 RepID=A0A1V4HYY8_NITVU|nr:DUF6634 family protein [Nitrobacter vulgaris]OPH83124.1 hypothetical protein B2M20_09095 [Nitrobacter vulgaris]